MATQSPFTVSSGLQSIQFSTRFDKLSLSTCHLRLKGPNAERQASGFFWRHGQKVFLVTNWHVVTGYHPFKKQSLQQGWCPDSLVVSYVVSKPPDAATISAIGENALAFSNPAWKVELTADFHHPPWIQHQQCLTDGIDVVLLEYDGEEQVSTIQCINDYNFDALFHYIGCDLFVIGYPLKDASDPMSTLFPVWKRASLASELVVPWKGKPAFLVDCRTSGGMSGSPVIRRVFGPATLADLAVKHDSAVASEFMGVYSGRLHDDENVASIGLIWHRKLIAEILANPTLGARL